MFKTATTLESNRLFATDSRREESEVDKSPSSKSTDSPFFGTSLVGSAEVDKSPSSKSTDSPFFGTSLIGKDSSEVDKSTCSKLTIVVNSPSTFSFSSRISIPETKIEKQKIKTL